MMLNVFSNICRLLTPGEPQGVSLRCSCPLSKAAWQQRLGRSLALPFIALIACCTSATVAADRPNILIILADDLGYADIGVNGCTDIPTPHIDSIAANGVRFTDGYSGHPFCAPARAALLSGRYQQRFGFENNSGPESEAAANFGLPRDVPTIAEKLKAAGYATGMVGKWHLGFTDGLQPHQRGFDSHFGFLGGAHGYLPDAARRAGAAIVRNGEPVTESEYLTDAFARESVAFIDGVQDKPWFLYLAFNAVHSPMHSTDDYESRVAHITNPKRKTFAAMLTALDDAVGDVLANIRERDEEENTLIFFYSDNGGPTPQTTSRNNPLRGTKGQVFEGGIRVPFLMQWKGTVAAGQTYREPVMGFDCHATALAAAGVDWASAQAASAETPPASAEAKATLDGIDLVPFVLETEGRKLDGDKVPHAQLFWRSSDNHAVRIGDWKLVTMRAMGDPMLFNLADDIGEQHDLAAAHPDKLKKLQTAFAEWETGTQPPKWKRGDDNSSAEPAKKKGRGVARIQQALKTADANADGKLSREEFPQKDLFDPIDADNDGFVTSEEVRVYFANRD